MKPIKQVRQQDAYRLYGGIITVYAAFTPRFQGQYFR